MTHTQLEHLKPIAAHLAKLIQKAETRFPFGWSNYCQDNTNLHGYAVQGIQGEVIACRCTRENATFIASAAGNAEAGWRVARAVIQNWIDLGEYLGASNPNNNPIRLPEKQSALLESILADFPLKLIQKP